MAEFSIHCYGASTWTHEACRRKGCDCPCHRTVGSSPACVDGDHDRCEGFRTEDELMSLRWGSSPRFLTFFGIPCDCPCHVRDLRQQYLELRRRL